LSRSPDARVALNSCGKLKGSVSLATRKDRSTRKEDTVCSTESGKSGDPEFEGVGCRERRVVRGGETGKKRIESLHDNLVKPLIGLKKGQRGKA